jgi:hypothetical protein
MKLRFLILTLLVGGAFLPRPAAAAEQYEAVVTITNTPVTGSTLTINTDVRTWTTSTPSSVQISITNSASANATNLFRALAANMPTGQVWLAYSATNAVKLFASPSAALAVSASNNWATVVITTNTVATAYTVRVPFTSEPSAAQRTNAANWLIDALNTYATTRFLLPAFTATLFSNTTAVITTGTVNQLTATIGTITTANITTGTVSVIRTGTVPFTVSVDTVTNAAGAAINVLKLTP